MKVYYDLHLHSCLSPCGDNDMSPYNLVNMAKLLGYDIIALTDHNSCENCESAVKIGKDIGITVVPGMELCTSEEIHTVCLFPDVEKAMRFSNFVKTTMPPVKNKEEIFGQQLIMDTEDGIKGKEDILLTLASSLSIEELPELVLSYGGICYPAHIDRHSYSVLSALGDFPSHLPFRAFELTPIANEDYYRRTYQSLEDKTLIRSSDAHYLQNMREAEFTVDIRENSPEALISFFKGE